MSKAIHWFRQDLRCYDNPALSHACAQHEQLIALYIYDKRTLGAAQHWWLHHSLVSLQKSLNEHQLSLTLRQGDPVDHLLTLIKEHHIDTVYWNRCYEPASIARDKALKVTLEAQGVDVISCNGSLLNEPWTVKNQSGSWFKVFSPFWRQAIKQVEIPVCSPIIRWPAGIKTLSDSLESWQLLPTKPDWAAAFTTCWQPGEAGAMRNLNRFIDQHLTGYKQQRDIPAKEATSKLSPHLHFGEISPWAVLRAIEQAKQDSHCDLQSADHFLSEVGWREFSYYLLYHFPQLPEQNFKQEFASFPWHHDMEALRRWQQGMTGFPIIDAGMRELWHTGYMHNRVRMMVASFLTKDLLIDWRVGAEWFWHTLLDADLANNSASWQWVAGCGADAAPYFRIFNPVLQSEKFDPQGTYIKQWVAELSEVPLKWLHKPWEAGTGINVGTYPAPLVNHAKARELALAYYRNMK